MFFSEEDNQEIGEVSNDVITFHEYKMFFRIPETLIVNHNVAAIAKFRAQENCIYPLHQLKNRLNQVVITSY